MEARCPRGPGAATTTTTKVLEHPTGLPNATTVWKDGRVY